MDGKNKEKSKELKKKKSWGPLALGYLIISYIIYYFSGPSADNLTPAMVGYKLGEVVGATLIAFIISFLIYRARDKKSKGRSSLSIIFIWTYIIVGVFYLFTY